MHFQPNQPVMVSNPHFFERSAVLGVIKQVLPNDLCLIDLLESCQMLDPQTGEINVKFVHDKFYANKKYLNDLPGPYIVFYSNGTTAYQEIEKRLYVRAREYGWFFISMTTPCLFPNAFTHKGHFVGAENLEGFLEMIPA